MAGTVHLITKNYERHPPITPPNPYLQAATTSYGFDNYDFVDVNGCWVSNSNLKGVYPLTTSTSVRESLVVQLDQSTNNNAVCQNQRTEVIFYGPTTASAQLLVVGRYVYANKDCYVALITGTFARNGWIDNDSYAGNLGSDITTTISAGVKYRAVLDCVGVSPTVKTVTLYTFDDPTTQIGQVSHSGSETGLQTSGVGGYGSRAGVLWDGTVCEVSRFTLGTDRTSGQPGIHSFSADGTTVTLWAREPDNFTGAKSYQWQVSTTGASTGFASTASGTGGTTLKLTNYSLAANTDHYFRMASTDAGNSTTYYSTVLGPVRRKPTYKRMLVSDSRGTQYDTLCGSTSWRSADWQRQYMERLLPDRFFSYPSDTASTSHGGAQTTDFLNSSGTYYAADLSAINTWAPVDIDVQLGINDSRTGGLSAATFKSNMLNIVAWLLGTNGTPTVWLHDPPWFYEATDAMDRLEGYSTSLDQIVAADTTGRVRRGARREAWRAGLGSSLFDGYDYAHVHSHDGQFKQEAMNRALAVAANAGNRVMNVGGRVRFAG